SVRRALEVAAMTAIAYALLALALDPIPGFHVGGGDRAMPKVAALCNLVAGIVGGASAFTALTSRDHRGDRSERVQVVSLEQSSAPQFEYLRSSNTSSDA